MSEVARRFKTGRTRPAARRMGMSLATYLRRADTFEPPKGPLKRYDKAWDCLKQVLLNDTLSCCTVSGVFHIEGVLLGNAGFPVKFTDAQIEAVYSAACGYKKGDPSTDNGGDEQAVLDYWREHGLVQGRRHIAGHVRLDATDPKQMQTAIALFENVYFGVSMPDAWVNPEPQGDGFTWGVAGPPIDANGHCFIGYDYDDKGIIHDTWGLSGHLTYDAAAKYAVQSAGGEAHCVISTDSIVKGMKVAPNGLDWPSLVSHFAMLGGNVSMSSVMARVGEMRQGDR